MRVFDVSAKHPSCERRLNPFSAGADTFTNRPVQACALLDELTTKEKNVHARSHEEIAVEGRPMPVSRRSRQYRGLLIGRLVTR